MILKESLIYLALIDFMSYLLIDPPSPHPSKAGIALGHGRRLRLPSDGHTICPPTIKNKFNRSQHTIRTHYLLLTVSIANHYG